MHTSKLMTALAAGLAAMMFSAMPAHAAGNPCNPCAPKAANPCAGKAQVAKKDGAAKAKKAANPCAPKNPCAPMKPMNPCAPK